MPSLRTALASLLLLATTTAYPILLQVDEDSERCFQFQIPNGDDAHLVGVIIPGEESMGDGKAEAWYFDQLYKLTAAKAERKVIPKKFPDEQPDYVAKHMSEFLQENAAETSNPAVVSLTNNPKNRRGDTQYKSKYFQPMVVNFISRTMNARASRKKREKAMDDIDGYHLCIYNRAEDVQIQMILDIVLVSEDIPMDLDRVGEGGFNKDTHLTPLEESLSDSIDAAQNILKEMRYMEQREQRMRKTTDSINSRVHWFSYLSVSVLLTVTYIQVTYLKRYFHKKKLM